jgi:hypothetical protein
MQIKPEPTRQTIAGAKLSGPGAIFFMGPDLFGRSENIKTRKPGKKKPRLR